MNPRKDWWIWTWRCRFKQVPGVEAAEALEGNAQAKLPKHTGLSRLWVPEFPKIGDPNIAPAIVGSLL